MRIQLEKSVSVIGVWFSRVFRKWLVGLVAITTVLDIIFVVLPRDAMPPVLREFQESGTNWPLTIAILVSAFFFSNFLVFREDRDEIEGLKRRSQESEEGQPRISVGFQDESGRLVKSLQIELGPLTPLPDFDALVREEDMQLAPKKQEKYPSKFQDLSFAWIAGRPNTHYQEEREQYLEDYRKYQVRRYEHDIARYRAFSISLIAENQADYPANDVRIELLMPSMFQRATKHQRYCLTKEEERKLGEVLKELKIQQVCGKPRRPEPIIKDVLLTSTLLDNRSYPPPPSVSSSYPMSNTSGPDYTERDGRNYISYHARSLVQHRPEDDFSPFSLWLGHIDKPSVWEIQVEITSANLRKPQAEALRIEIVMGKGSTESSSD